jgi:hypothetical protein
MVNDSIKAKGTLQLVLLDAQGNIKQQDEHNLVVNTGLAYIASRMRDTTAAVMTHMAIGSGTVAAAAGDSALGSQLSTRVGLDSTTIVTTTATAAVTVTVPASVFNAGDTITVIQDAAGQVTFAAATSVTIVSTGATTASPKIRAAYAGATVYYKTGGASPTVTIVGDLA